MFAQQTRVGPWKRTVRQVLRISSTITPLLFAFSEGAPLGHIIGLQNIILFNLLLFLLAKYSEHFDSMSSTDVESLQPIVRHRNKCVYASLACLAFAVVATSLSGAAMFVVVWRELQTQTELINNHINSAQSMNQDSPSFAPHTSLPEEGMFKVSCVSKQPMYCVIMQSFVSMCNGKKYRGRKFEAYTKCFFFPHEHWNDNSPVEVYADIWHSTLLAWCFTHGALPNHQNFSSKSASIVNSLFLSLPLLCSRDIWPTWELLPVRILYPCHPKWM